MNRALLTACILAHLAGSVRAVTPQESAAIRGFLSQHCARCHGPEKQKAHEIVDGNVNGKNDTVRDEWPVVLFGGLAGKTKPGGRYVEMPHYGAKKHRTLSNLYLTLLQAAGKPRDKFGMPDTGLRDIEQRGIIAELLA